MIYLIDDKKSRQNVLGWEESKLIKFTNILKPVYSYKQIIDEGLNSLEKIYANGSIILFHESFFNIVDNHNIKDSLRIRNELNILCKEREIPLIKFSGSNVSRSINELNVGLPVSILYQNLEYFINSVVNNDAIELSLKTLMFGNNYNIEEILQLKKEIWETRFQITPLLNSKINELNAITGKSIDVSLIQNPIIIKSLINE